ncbi:MAG: anti-sigma factor antagonist [Firmicutes bacterium]|nr:anti-sigma factor antagonist [Bacillota bacterium]
MANLTMEREGEALKVCLNGRIDSISTPEIDKRLTEETAGISHLSIDLSGVQYISSTGLRLILKIKKLVGDVKLVSVPAEVYDILKMTGFTEMMEVEKALRVLSVEGCEIIGTGANGTVYKYDEETVVKAFRSAESLEEIQREIELARTAFVLGVPTAIPFDIVKLEDGRYGSVFELLNAKILSKMLISGEMSLEEIAAICMEILESVHGAMPKAGALPSMKELAVSHLMDIRPELDEAAFEKINRLLSEMPDWPYMVHGDFHIKNIMMQNGESLLIDMDTICTGDPVFEFAGIYNAYIGFAELFPENDFSFFGIEFDKLKKLYDMTFDMYCKGIPEETRKLATDRIRLIAACKLLRYMTRRTDAERPDRGLQMRHAHEIIDELLPGLESLSLSELLAK